MTQTRWDNLRWYSSHPACKVISAGMLYFLVAIFCIEISLERHLVQIWFSNALLLIIILRSERRLAWWYLIAGLIANVLANVATGSPPPLAVGLAFSNSVELIPVLLLLEMMESRPSMPNILYTLVFSSALAGLTASSMFPYNSGFEYLTHSLDWFSTDFLSLLMIIPIGLAYTHKRYKKLFHTKKLIELMIVSALSCAIIYLSINFTPSPFLSIALALLILSLRFNLFGTTILCTLSSIAFIIITYFDFVSHFYYPADIYKNFGYLLFSLALIPSIILSYQREKRHHYEEQLKESEKRFKGAILYSSVGMSIVSPDGKWLLVNPALCDILGYTEKELLKMTFHDVTHPDDLSHDLNLSQKIASGNLNNYQLEKRYIRKNGEVIWISLIVSGVFDESGKFLYYISQIENIDHRKRVEKALQDSEQRWKFALESGIQGVWDWNAETDKVFYSHTWKSMLGYTDDDIGEELEDWSSRIHPQDAVIMKKSLKDHLEGKTDIYTAEYRIKAKSGEYRWVLDRGKIISKTSNGHPSRIIGTMTDIESLKTSEHERVQLTKRLELAIDAGKIGLFEFNLRADALSWDNRSLEIYDINLNQSHHRLEDWYKHIDPRDKENIKGAFYNTLHNGAPLNEEFRILTRFGKIRYIHTKALPIFNANKEIVSVLGLNWDVTEERNLTNALFEEKERLDITLKSIGDAVVVTDQDGYITFASTSAEQLLEFNPHELPKKRLDQICNLMQDQDKEAPINPIALCLMKDQVIHVDKPVTLETRSGIAYFIQYNVNPLRSANSEVIGCVLVIHDVTQAKDLQNKLEHQAAHDELTGLINRREFEERLSYLINTHDTQKRHILAFLDLDRFKVINDTAGHAAGDELLKAIALILQKNTRASDLVARIGGDEFALILPNCSVANAKSVANHIMKAVSNYRLHWDDKIYDIGMSIGLVSFHPKEITLERLIAQADSACYDAKHLGGDSVSVYSHNGDHLHTLQSEIKMMPRITAALENNQFVLHTRQILPTQPTNDKQQTHEILLRMLDHDGKLIMPSQFIKIAERHHIMPAIDEWVLQELLINQGTIIAAQPHLAISINISYQSIQTPSFHQKVIDWLAKTTIPYHRIGFEITERALQENLDMTLNFLKLIEEAGCFVSLDDFGSGLSSFTYLKNFQMKFVKIDGQFTRMLNHSQADRLIVESINNLAHSLDAKTIAEFVETPELMTIVKEMKIDYMQGNAVAPEQPLEALLKPIKTHA